METFLAVLVVEMIKAAAGSFGKELGSRAGSRMTDTIWPKFEVSGKQEVLSPLLEGRGAPSDERQVNDHLAAEMRRDPTFKSEVIKAVNAECRNQPDLVSLFLSVPEQLFGWSPEQKKAQRGRCPVGNELLILPSYYNADGTPILGGVWQWWSQFPRTAVAKCRRGHRWPVFAITSDH